MTTECRKNELFADSFIAGDIGRHSYST